MPSRGWRLSAAAACCALPTFAGLVVPAPQAVSAPPVKVLLLGDSVTQGSSGDWTWRYRLWQSLRAGPDPVDFVGPRHDLWDYVANHAGADEYLEPAFDQDHAARWGMTLAHADTPADELVATYAPDVVVVMLGVNDLGTRDPALVDQDTEDLVAAVRAVDPEVDIVLSTVTQTWFEGATELNDLLLDTAADLDSAGSRVLLARPDRGYTRGGHTYDGLHPNSQGEVLIAAAVQSRLAELDIGSGASRPTVVPPLGPRIPSRLTATLREGTASLSWTESPGADTTQIQRRDLTTGDGWEVAVDEASGLGARLKVPAGHQLQLRVLPRKGWLLAAADVPANVVTLTRPAVPRRTTVATGGSWARVSWRAARYAEGYRVEVRRAGGPWRVVPGPHTGRVLTLRGLDQGEYAVRVRALGPDGPGPASDRVRFRLR